MTLQLSLLFYSLASAPTPMPKNIGMVDLELGLFEVRSLAEVEVEAKAMVKDQVEDSVISTVVTDGVPLDVLPKNHRTYETVDGEEEEEEEEVSYIMDSSPKYTNPPPATTTPLSPP